MRRAAAALLLAVVFLPAVGSPAEACSCVQRTPLEQYATADVVFTGSLVSVQNPTLATSSMDPVTYRFDVARVLKGSAAANASVQSALSSASCGLELGEVGAQFTVFARFVDGRLSSGLCDGTHPGEADPSLPVSGTLLGPEPQGPASPWLLGALAAAALAGVALLMLRRRAAPATV